MSVFVVLGLIWAAVLIPPMLRARAERRAEFIDSFQEQMGALGKGQREAVAVTRERVHAPRRHVSSVKRRRDVLGGLVGAMLGALILGAFPSLRIVWALFLFLLNVFIGYVSLLVHYRDRRRAALAPAQAVRAPASAGRRRHIDPGTLAPALDSTR